MRQIQLFSPRREASERVQRRFKGFETDKTDRSRASSVRIEILTDIDPQLSMLPWFHRSIQVRSAWRDGAAAGLVAVLKISRPNATHIANDVKRPIPAC
jgi:hypothetical protein